MNKVKSYKEEYALEALIPSSEKTETMPQRNSSIEQLSSQRTGKKLWTRSRKKE